MNNIEVLFFILCPIVMALAWAVLYLALREKLKNERQELLLQFTIGILITTVTTILVVHNIREGGKQESYEQVKISQRTVFVRFEEHTSTHYDIEGDTFNIKEDWVATPDNNYHLSNIEGNKQNYKSGDSIYIYRFLNKFILSKEKLSDVNKIELANQYRKYTRYYWNFLWILFSAIITYTNLDQWIFKVRHTSKKLNSV